MRWLYRSLQAGPIIRSGWFIREICTVRDVDGEIHISIDTGSVKCTGLFPLPCFNTGCSDFMPQLFPDTSAVAGARIGAVIDQIPVWRVSMSCLVSHGEIVS